MWVLAKVFNYQGSRPRFFQRRTHEAPTFRLRPSKGGSKIPLRNFANRSNSCVARSLCDPDSWTTCYKRSPKNRRKARYTLPVVPYPRAVCEQWTRVPKTWHPCPRAVLDTLVTNTVTRPVNSSIIGSDSLADFWRTRATYLYCLTSNFVRQRQHIICADFLSAVQVHREKYELSECSAPLTTPVNISDV